MNFLAHGVIASVTGSGSPERVLGAVLPDLATMVGVRPSYEDLPAEVYGGVVCHRATDRAFHGDRDFLAGAAAIRETALGRDLPPGASRAAAHLGWELLLDGEVARVTDAAERFRQALRVASVADAAFPVSERLRWGRLARRLLDDQSWLGYDDPRFVAGRIFHRLQGRPRLRLPVADVAALGDILAEAKPSVGAASGSVLGRVLRRVDGDAPGRARTSSVV